MIKKDVYSSSKPEIIKFKLLLDSLLIVPIGVELDDTHFFKLETRLSSLCEIQLLSLLDNGIISVIEKGLSSTRDERIQAVAWKVLGSVYKHSTKQHWDLVKSSKTDQNISNHDTPKLPSIVSTIEKALHQCGETSINPLCQEAALICLDRMLENNEILQRAYVFNKLQSDKKSLSFGGVLLKAVFRPSQFVARAAENVFIRLIASSKHEQLESILSPPEGVVKNTPECSFICFCDILPPLHEISDEGVHLPKRRRLINKQEEGVHGGMTLRTISFIESLAQCSMGRICIRMYNLINRSLSLLTSPDRLLRVRILELLNSVTKARHYHLLEEDTLIPQSLCCDFNKPTDEQMYHINEAAMLTIINITIALFNGTKDTEPYTLNKQIIHQQKEYQNNCLTAIDLLTSFVWPTPLDLNTTPTTSKDTLLETTRDTHPHLGRLWIDLIRLLCKCVALDLPKDSPIYSSKESLFCIRKEILGTSQWSPFHAKLVFSILRLTQTEQIQQYCKHSVQIVGGELLFHKLLRSPYTTSPRIRVQLVNTVKTLWQTFLINEPRKEYNMVLCCAEESVRTMAKEAFRTGADRSVVDAAACVVEYILFNTVHHVSEESLYASLTTETTVVYYHFLKTQSFFHD